MPEQPNTCAEIFRMMPDQFNADAAAGVEATYQFNLLGDDGGVWHVEVSGSGCKVGDGAAPHANITVEMLASDYLEMIRGKLNPQMAFMGGKLKIKGDMSLALKMQQIFPTQAD